MRRAWVIATLALMLLAVLAAPAAAQKDPFHPVVDPGAATTTGTGTTGTGTTAGSVVTGTTGVGSEGLANTGSDVTPWLVIAYGLVAVGAAFVVMGRLRAAPSSASITRR